MSSKEQTEHRDFMYSRITSGQKKFSLVLLEKMWHGWVAGCWLPVLKIRRANFQLLRKSRSKERTLYSDFEPFLDFIVKKIYFDSSLNKCINIFMTSNFCETLVAFFLFHSVPLGRWGS